MSAANPEPKEGERPRKKPEDADEQERRVDEGVEETFPASDPPAFNPGRASPGQRKDEKRD